MREFLFQMSATGRAESSVAAYGRELNRLALFLADRPVACVTSSDVSQFLASPAVRLKRDGSAKGTATTNRTRAVLKAFFAWCERTARIARNPAFLIRTFPVSEGPICYMSRRDISRFLVAIKRSRHRLARRDYALFSTIAYMGLRLSEAAQVAWGDFDEGRRRLVLKSAKGGRRAVRHVPWRVIVVLVEHRRQTADTARDAPIFRTRRDAALSPRTIQYRFRFWLSRARILGKFSVHSLRHTFATLLYRATRDLLLVSRALGHRDVRTTQRYAHIEDDALLRAVNAL
ncbi:MAG: tyrosine-type recombinase/integrase [Candidatus Rokubacteria bacterium]|nr:tyrosine-type recombinase/integrase [Candidatus Rokubacteria bacterium]